MHPIMTIGRKTSPTLPKARKSRTFVTWRRLTPSTSATRTWCVASTTTSMSTLPLRSTSQRPNMALSQPPFLATPESLQNRERRCLGSWKTRSQLDLVCSTASKSNPSRLEGQTWFRFTSHLLCEKLLLPNLMEDLPLSRWTTPWRKRSSRV